VLQQTTWGKAQEIEPTLQTGWSKQLPPEAPHPKHHKQAQSQSTGGGLKEPKSCSRPSPTAKEGPPKTVSDVLEGHHSRKQVPARQTIKSVQSENMEQESGMSHVGNKQPPSTKKTH
jgi:hypothetical protein